MVMFLHDRFSKILPLRNFHIFKMESVVGNFIQVDLEEVKVNDVIFLFDIENKVIAISNDEKQYFVVKSISYNSSIKNMDLVIEDITIPNSDGMDDPVVVTSEIFLVQGNNHVN